jgi:hypothetical protein
MPRIATLKSGAALYIYADDHGPPHFHVRGAGSNAQIHMDTLHVMRGTVSRTDLAEAVAFAVANPGLLAAKWKEYNERD